MDEIISGSIAGSVGKLFEYPFDTVKVRLQAQSLSSPQYSGAVDCLTKTLRSEGFLGLYKGVSAPIVAAPAENATLFEAFRVSSSVISPYVSNISLQSLIAGCFSGLAASFVLTPIEYVKCRVQVDNLSRKANIGTLIANTIKQDGIAQFWRGQMGTAIRECGGSASWFGIYYTFKEDLGSLLAGALAGVGYNISLFPADSIKSRMQTDDRKLSFWKVGKEIVRESGLRGLYRGCLVTCVRAGPSNFFFYSIYNATRLSLPPCK